MTDVLAAASLGPKLSNVPSPGGPGLFDITGRVALVTGASKGIGRAIATALADAGASVVISSRKGPACAEVAAEITAKGGHAAAVAANAGEPDDCARAVSATMEAFGRLDILVNNAATNPEVGPLVRASERAFHKTVAVNMLGPLLLVQHAHDAWMGDHGGAIINIASVAGILPDPFLATYSATKAALISMTKSWAQELGPRGIRVNAIAPALVRTDMVRLLLETPAIYDSALARFPLGRIGEPRDLAGAAVWLASDASAWVTGAVIVVDGGYCAGVADQPQDVATPSGQPGCS